MDSCHFILLLTPSMTINFNYLTLFFFLVFFFRRSRYFNINFLSWRQVNWGTKKKKGWWPLNQWISEILVRIFVQDMIIIVNLFNWISIYLVLSPGPRRGRESEFPYRWGLLILVSGRGNLISLITIDWFDIAVRLMWWCTWVRRRGDVGQRWTRFDVFQCSRLIFTFHVRDGIISRAWITSDFLLG